MKKIEVLLVEDSVEDAEMTLDVFKKKNLANKVHWVEDGEQALDFIFETGKYLGNESERNLKLILLDLKLPKVSGLEVLEKIRSDEKTKSIPIVILTSSKEQSDIIESYKLGVNSYLVKPVDFEKFSNSVAELGYYWLVLNEPPIEMV